MSKVKEILEQLRVVTIQSQPNVKYNEQISLINQLEEELFNTKSDNTEIKPEEEITETEITETENAEELDATSSEEPKEESSKRGRKKQS